MAIYPGNKDTLWKPGYTTEIADVQGILVHIAVSESHWPYFAPGTASHFYCRRNGDIGQMIDTDKKCGSNYQGNSRLLAVECQGGVNDANGEPLTSAQLESLARLFEWASRVHMFPLALMPNSQVTSMGVGWHRLGIDGNFPTTGILRGRRQLGGGQHYSYSSGKICPGDAKIKQIPSIVARANVLRNPPKTTPVEQPEDGMESYIKAFYRRLLGRRARQVEVDSRLYDSVVKGLTANQHRALIAGSAEGKAFAALPAATREARIAALYSGPE